MYKLKAYFGMVPAEDGDGYEDDYVPERRSGYAVEEDYEPPGEQLGARRRPLGAYRSEYPTDREAEPGHRNGVVDDYPEAPVERLADRVPARRDWSREAPIRGALAQRPEPEPIPRARPASEPAVSPARITTLRPRSYHEARTIGEHYRDGIPVIVNLTEMQDADAKRVVDFAAGLVFALRGSIDKVTSKVFLLSPANVDVTAEDKRRLAQGQFPGQS